MAPLGLNLLVTQIVGKLLSILTSGVRKAPEAELQHRS